MLIPFSRNAAAPARFETLLAGFRRLERVRGGRSLSPTLYEEYSLLLTAWQSHAEQAKNPQAQFELGRLHELGRPVELISRDAVRAAYWYRLAADQAHAPAQHALAVLLREGRGVTRDLQCAGELDEAAARNGHVQAAMSLALIRFVDNDIEGATELWRQAAPQTPRASFNLGIIAERAGALDEALAWYTRAAQGLSSARVERDRVQYELRRRDKKRL